MKKKVIIGIDFSKLTLDVTCFSIKNTDLKYYKQFLNSEEGCKEMIKWVRSFYPQSIDWLFCGEYTGIYTMTTALVLNEAGLDLWLENPSQIKLSSGFNRDKNDKIDSYRIALYASRFMDRVKLYKPKNDVLLRIRELVRYKDRLTKAITQLSVPVKELKRVKKNCETVTYIDESSKEIIYAMKAQLKCIENKMTILLNNDPELKRLYNLISSVVGVGMQTTIYLLVYTNGFESFNNPRQLSCYCGIAPFAKNSGTSIRSKTQISHYANKKLKTLLHMCALNAIRYDPVIKEYYERKVNEGKHKMKVINNVKNKIIHRVCAVVQSGEKYDKNYNQSLTLAA
ncbi:MAG: IS110 family transposase [Salinivirgaceae bacterium]|jgi:transposase|nr:IS110 family transposase [Salinivirgaceae bacterium]